MLKRILALTLVATMLMTMACGVVFAAEGITLKAAFDKTSVKAGDIVTLSIYIEGVDSVGMATWEMPYDTEAFEYVDGSVTSALGNNTANVMDGVILMMSMAGGSTADAVQTAQFKALKEVEDVTDFEFAFDDACTQVCNAGGDDFEVTHENATVSIAPSFNATYATPAEATVEIGATEADVLAALPETVVVKDSEEGTKTDNVAVTWACDTAFDSAAEGTLTYTGTLDPASAGAAILADGLVATATVNIVKIADGIDLKVAFSALGLGVKLDGETPVEQTAEEVAKAVADKMQNKVTLKKGNISEEITLDASAFVADNAVTNAGDTATVTITVPAGFAATKFAPAAELTATVAVELIVAKFDATKVAEIADIPVELGTTEADVKAMLPATVTVTDDSGVNQEEIAVDGWTSVDYNANVPGEYVFEAEVGNGERASVPVGTKAQVKVIVTKLVAENDNVMASAETVGLLLKYNDSGVAVERSAEEVAAAVAEALGYKITLQKGGYVEEIELTADMITADAIPANGGNTTVTITLPASVDSKYFDLNGTLTLDVAVVASEAVLRVVPSVTKVKTGETFTLEVYVDGGADTLYLDAASWTIPYDTALFEYVDGTLYSAFGSNSTSVRGGMIRMMALGHKTINTDEPVQYLDLKAIKDVDVAEEYTFDFDVLDSELSGENGDLYTIAHQSAVVTIVPSFTATKIADIDPMTFEIGTTEEEVLDALPEYVYVTNEDGTKKEKVEVGDWTIVPEGTEFDSEVPGTYVYEAEIVDSDTTQAVLDDLVGEKVQIEVKIDKITTGITIEAGIDGSAEGIDGGIVYIRPRYAFGESYQAPEDVAKAVAEALGYKVTLSKGDYVEVITIDETMITAANGVEKLGDRTEVTITIPAGTEGENYFKIAADTTITLTAIVKMLGDANIDGVVNGKDAFTIQKYVLFGEEKVTPNWSATEANVINDSRINGRDAIAIQRYVLYGIIY